VARPKKNREVSIVHFSFFDLLFGAFGAFVFLMIMQVLATLNMVDVDIQKVVDTAVQEKTALKNELEKYKDVGRSLKNLQQQHDQIIADREKIVREKDKLEKQIAQLEAKLNATEEKIEVLTEFKQKVKEKGDLVKTLEDENRELEQKLNFARQKLATIKAVPLKIKTKAFPTTITEEKVVVALAAEGGSPPYSWEISGNLPKGLSVNRITGDISGVVKSSGKYAFKAKVTDATGESTKSKDDIYFNVIKKYEPPRSKVTYWFLFIAIILVLYFLHSRWQKYKSKKIIREMKAKGFSPGWVKKA
jgi:DNA gyrase/topoisomerase IV subunit A